MKKLLCYLLLAVMATLWLCGCGETPAVTAATTEQEEPPVVPITTGTPVLIDPDDFNLTEENSHATVKTNAYMEADARSYLVLNSQTTGQARYDKAQYPRLKKLANGSYILFWQYGPYGQHIYYALSDDLVNWSAPVVFYNSANYKYKNESGTEVRSYFVNCDAAVLNDGTLFTVVSVRESGDYLAVPQNAGIYACVSRDNGKTFEEPYKIYTGVNWEPSVLVLPDGEIQVFFSQVSPAIVYWGRHEDRNSTGTGMIVSRDGGKTWTPDVTGSPYQAKIAAQQYIMDVEGKPCFTDQMFVATLLYDGSVAGACEAKQVDKSFRISIVRSDAKWSEEIGIDKEGPADRTDALCQGAGPYLVKMPSGETLLTYGVNSSISYLRVGDGAAREWSTATVGFQASGYWGSIEVTGSNRVTGVFPVSSSANSILLKNFYLNHAITAKPAPIAVDGNNSDDWRDVTDALFLGAGSQAQATLRAAYRNGVLSLLCERRDSSLTDIDKTYLYLADTAGTAYRFAIDSTGAVKLERGIGSTFAAFDVPFASASKRIEGEDGGIVTEIEIALSDLGLAGREGCMANMMILNADADGSSAQYLLSGTDGYDASTWLNIHFAGEEAGAPALAAGAPATPSAIGNLPGDGFKLLRVDDTFIAQERLCQPNCAEIEAAEENGTAYGSLRITDPYDPFASVVCEDIDATTAKYLLVRYRTNENAGGNSALGFFWASGSTKEFGYTAAAATSVSIKKDGKWHTALIDLSDEKLYKGALKTFRLDPFDGSNANKGDRFDICWIAFADSYAAAVPYVD